MRTCLGRLAGLLLIGYSLGLAASVVVGVVPTSQAIGPAVVAGLLVVMDWAQARRTR